MEVKEAIEAFKAREPVMYENTRADKPCGYTCMEHLIYRMDGERMVLSVELTTRMPGQGVGGSVLTCDPKNVRLMTEDEKKAYFGEPEPVKKKEPVSRPDKPVFYRKIKSYSEGCGIIGEYIGKTKVAEYYGFLDRRRNEFKLYPREQFQSGLPYVEKKVEFENVEK